MYLKAREMWQTSIKPDRNVEHMSLSVAETTIKSDMNVRHTGVSVAGTTTKSAKESYQFNY